MDITGDPNKSAFTPLFAPATMDLISLTSLIWSAFAFMAMRTTHDHDARVGFANPGTPKSHNR